MVDSVQPSDIDAKFAPIKTDLNFNKLPSSPVKPTSTVGSADSMIESTMKAV